MGRYVALLRGINVGGHKKVAMADLRALLASLGYGDAATYLQSGNAVFAADGGSPDTFAREIEQALATELGLSVDVLVRTPEELAAVVAANPFPAAASTPSWLHVCFLSEPPGTDWLGRLDPRQYAPDEFSVVGRELYLWYANGVSQTTLTRDFWKGLNGKATTRNWNTVTRLREMAAG